MREKQKCEKEKSEERAEDRGKNERIGDKLERTV